MKAKETKDGSEECLVTVRLAKDLTDFVDDLAESACNTRAGVVRLAIKSFREACAKGAEQKVLGLPHETSGKGKGGLVTV